MSGFREAESFEAELAKVEERLREIERIEASLLENIVIVQSIPLDSGL